MEKPSTTTAEPENIGPSLDREKAVFTKDELYFMEGEFMVFQVEKRLFRVPSYLFSKESHIFGGMFRLPLPYPHENGGVEGASEANPIILPDEFTKTDFQCLLKALYPLSFTLRLSLARDEWFSILRLSTKWYFLNLRKTAILELESPYQANFALLSSLERIRYGRKYRISSWLLSGLVDLVMRDQSINDDDALTIDSDYPTTVYKLFRTRELRFRGYLTTRAAGEREIESLFMEEFTQVRADEKAYEESEVEIKSEKLDHEPLPTSISVVPLAPNYKAEKLHNTLSDSDPYYSSWTSAAVPVTGIPDILDHPSTGSNVKGKIKKGAKRAATFDF